MIIIVKSIMKNYINLFRSIKFKIKYAMQSTPIFPCIMTVISKFTLYFDLSNIYFQFFIQKHNKFLRFGMIHAALLLITSFFYSKLIYFIACSLKDSQNIFMQSLPLYTPCLFSMLLNEDIVDFEKPDVMCLLPCLFPQLFLHP